MAGQYTGPTGPDWTTRLELVPGRIPEMQEQGRRLRVLKIAQGQQHGGTPNMPPAVYKRGAT
jgi:hypothetical protein